MKKFRYALSLLILVTTTCASEKKSDLPGDLDLVDGIEPMESVEDLAGSKLMKVEFTVDDISEQIILNGSAEAESSQELIPSSSKKSYLKLTKQLANYTKIVGENIRLKCEVEGFPPPRFKWFKNEAPVREEKSKVTIRRFSSGGKKYISRLRISKLEILDTAYYKCQASNDGHQVKTTAILKVKLSEGELPGTIPSFAPLFPHIPNEGIRGPTGDMTGLTGNCQLYKGNSVCTKLVGNNSVFIRPPNTISDLDRRLMATLSAIWSNKKIAESCEKYAIQVMCYHTFPLCTGPNKSPKSLCKSECDLLQKDICVNEYALAKQNDLIGKNNIIPDCQDLPDADNDCIRIGISIKTEEPTIEDECFTSRGEGYRGRVSATISGKECLPWSRKILDKLSRHPELKDHNYCRNPGGQEEQPWCYTGDELKPVEVCDIPECGEFIWIYVAIPCVCVVVLTGLLCAICCIRRRSRATSSQTAKMVNDLPSQGYNTGHKYMGHDVEMNSMLQKTIGPIRVKEVPPSTVTYLEELGEGAFGNVYRGEVSALNMDNTVTPVVIKTLKTGASTALFQNFRQEVEVMTDLKHPNIICLLAVCVYDQPFCMLFEFPMGGNLHEHLMKSSRSASTTSDKSKSCFGLDVGEFLCISTQVASGMEYLSSQHYVHRDLAARNCLIGDGLNVKISNFGLARDTYACDYFLSPTNGLLPIRWMPAEAILYGRFSTESDIWSFGVLLWEILSHGRQPYYGYSNQEVIDMISSHQVLPCPDDSSTQVYGLMLECWSDVAPKRPTFQELHLRLHSWQVLHNMGNLNSSQFFRPHSDSQYSSTGPSNRTGSTHVSSVAAPSSKSLHDSSTHSGISSQPVTVIGLDRSISASSRPQPSSSTRSNSPSLSSSTAGLCANSIHQSEPRVSNI